MDEKKIKKLPNKVIHDWLEFDTTYHPGVDTKDLIHAVHRQVVSGHDFVVPKVEEHRGADRYPICWNCGLSPHLAEKAYSSRVKIVRVRGNNAIWELGGPRGQWLLKDDMNTPDSGGSIDYETQKFLREAKSGIPLVEEMYKFGDEKFYFIIMSRAKGIMLSDIDFDEISDEDWAEFRRHFNEVEGLMRQFTSPYMQRVDGGELLDTFIGNCRGHGCLKTGRNVEEWLENLSPGIRKGLLWRLWKRDRAGDPAARNAWVKDVDEQLVKLKANFPKADGPYVLYHGDLNPSNIFVSNDNAEKKWKITAIIDWETAGYFPWWAGIREWSEHKRSLFIPATFDKKDLEPMINAIDEVQKAHEISLSPKFTRHLRDGVNWWWSNTVWSECDKIRKHYLEYDFGWPLEHEDVFDPAPTDSDAGSDVWTIDEKEDREFQRFYNEVERSKRKSKIT